MEVVAYRTCNLPECSYPKNTAFQETFQIPPYGTVKVTMNESVTNGYGLVTIDSEHRNSVIARVLHSKKNQSGELQYAYSIAALEGASTERHNTYNTFLNQECKLIIANPTHIEAQVTLNISRNNGTPVVKQYSLPIPAKTVVEEDICSKDANDTYGIVSTLPEKEHNGALTPSITTTMLRIGQGDSYRFTAYR